MHFSFKIFSILFVLLAGNLLAETVVLQESGPDGGPWKFLDDGSNQETAWIAPDFDDDNWNSGDPLFAFDTDEDEVTDLEPGHITYYFRKSFEVSNVSEITSIALNLLRDDGAVVYLNGTEIARDNMPTGTIIYTTPASAEVINDPPDYDEDTYFGFNITPLSLLVDGTNYLAVEIHQYEAAGPDVRFDLQLLAEGNWSWSFWDAGSTPPNSVTPAVDWKDIDYDESEDTRWDSGTPIFGFGGTGVNTSLSSGNKTYYFRKIFQVADASAVDYWVCNIIRDDGAVVYLNGAEAFRTNMPSGTINYVTSAEEVVGPTADNTFFNFGVDPSLLVDGDNCVAVEVHQFGTESSDLRFDLNLVESVVRKAPYLMFLGTSDEMLVMWQTYTNIRRNEETIECNIVWGTDTDYLSGGEDTTEFNSDHQHQYLFTGLTARTKYFYKVTINGEIYEGSFYSAPADDAPNVSFIAYGDTRTHPKTHDTVVEDINTLYNDSPNYQTIVFHTGDLVGGGGEENRFDTEFFNPNANEIQTMLQNLPMIANRGNHEGDASVFKKYFPYPYPDPYTNNSALNALQLFWSFDYGPVHFVMLDHYVSKDALEADSVAFGAEQITWLKHDLANTDKTWKVIVVHHPGWTASVSPTGHSSSQAVQEHIHPLCKTYGVQLVLSGHNHYYARALVEGVTYITTGGGTYDLYAPLSGQPYILKAEEALHFCKFDITGTSMNVVVYNTDTNTQIESFPISDDAPLPVELTSFETGYLKNRAIISWTTQSETDNLGWNIYRSESENGYEDEDYIQINSTLIDGMGTTTSPTNYSFEDEYPVVEGHLYWYWLQSISTNNELELFEPVSLVIPFASQLPAMTILETNYPNPFNPETTISFSIKENETGILTIYNLRGQKILSESFEAGNYQYSWDARNLSSGIYFYKLSSPTLNLTNKMLLLK